MSDSHPYTCLTCNLAFSNTASQRDHYASDLHRYNAKRRVAGLPAITEAVFNEKVAEHTTVQEEAQSLYCSACKRSFASETTYSSHMASKKHREVAAKIAEGAGAGSKAGNRTETGPSSLSGENSPSTSSVPGAPSVGPTPAAPAAAPTAPAAPAAPAPNFESSGDARLDLILAKRLQASPPIPPTHCLFCTAVSDSAESNAEHMFKAHSFFIPEREYLTDLPGLLSRLGELVGTWNVCVFCGKGCGHPNLDLDLDVSASELARRNGVAIQATRAHMQSKSHCKIKYDTEEDQLEWADFYDFRASYPDYAKGKTGASAADADADADADAWEDDDDVDAENADIVVDADADSDADTPPPSSRVTFGDSEYELRLPSGTTIGHRAFKNVYRQNHTPYVQGVNPFGNSNRRQQEKSQQLLRLQDTEMPASKLANNALVPAKGGGWDGKSQLIKARNRGEAKKAGEKYGEIHAYQRQAYIRGLRGNNQEHFRDHLLQ